MVLPSALRSGFEVNHLDTVETTTNLKCGKGNVYDVLRNY